MSEMGMIVHKDTIRFERLLAAPIERVWEHLTRPDGLSTWLMESSPINDCGLIQFKSDIPDPAGVYHTVIGMVNEFEPPRRLAYSWFEPEESAATHVSFELEQRGEKVLLRLTHSGLAPEWMPLAGAGWHTNLERLASVLESCTRIDFDEQLFSHLIGKYGIALAAAGIVVSGSGLPATGQATDPMHRAINSDRNRLLGKYQQVWKDADELQRKMDLLNRSSSSDNNRSLDDINRELKKKLFDLRQIELDISDLDKALL